MSNRSHNTGLSRHVYTILLLICLLPAGEALAITLGQIDTFEDGTLQNWQTGLSAVTAEHMSNVSSGGPDGIDDNYLQMFSDSTDPFGGNRLTFFNREQWTGDWLAADVTAITLDVKNFSSSVPLNLRLGINGGFVDPTGTSIIGGTFVTSGRIVLNSGSDWTRVLFMVRSSDFVSVLPGRSSNTAGNDILATLSNVTELRILNSELPDWNGLPVDATLGVDNIAARIQATAVPLPPALALFGPGLIALMTIARKQKRYA